MAKASLQAVAKLFEKLTYRIENNYHTEEHLLSMELENYESLKGVKLSLTECHILAAIGDNGSVNGTFLSKSMGITKGGVSKVISKLVAKSLVTVEKLPHNKKEIYYSLTTLGQKVYDLHSIMHQKAEDLFIEQLEHYSTEEIEAVGKFLKDVVKRK